ncbi:hypothetical protein ACJRO7_025948 [Eucalyptus globulus]|uniref:Laccase n=2 Tax=Eucalyptus globulus TaxID=34317 RepID=A0ABD3KGR2_EUCGL
MGPSLCELRWLLALLGALLLLLPLAQGEDHYYTFILRETNFTRLCTTKSILTVNDSFPGPALYVRKGDTAYVNVINEGYYGVTIHWHGIKQPRNPWFDGPEYITQCPISPGTNFTYQVLFTSEEGTLWWHAHSDWTRATVHGAIIIKPALGTTYPFPEPDDEEVLVFASWYDEDVMELMIEALSEGGQATSSNAYCINGQPGDFYNCSRETTHRISADYGKTNLLRLVNSVQNTNMYFAIANHSLTVVGLDGAYIKPLVTRYIMITPGQSMDILVTADQPLGEYYIILSPFFDGQADDFDHSIASAIFQYSGNYTYTGLPAYPSDFPGWEDKQPATFFVKQLRSLNSAEHPIDVPKDNEITTRMFITIEVGLRHCPNDSCAGPLGDRLAAALNNISFANPSVDVLQAYYNNITGYYTADFPDLPPVGFNFTSDDLGTANVTMVDKGTKVKVLNYNASVEIILQGTDVMNSAETHPMHLHGFRFYVVGLGEGNFDNGTAPETYNLYDPPEMNTVPAPRDGWAVIRFRANNPGKFTGCAHANFTIEKRQINFS